MKYLFIITAILFFSSCKKEDTNPIVLDEQIKIDTTSSTHQKDTTKIPQRYDAVIGTEANSSIIVYLTPDKNRFDDQEFLVARWTQGGAGISGYGKHRQLLQINLSSIPTDAVIDSAYINFYMTDIASSSNIGTNAIDSNSHYGSNAIAIEKITSSWEENSVTWNTKPSTSSTEKISLPRYPKGHSNSGNIYITNFVKDWVANPSTNFGMSFRMQDEITNSYRRVLFAGNGHLRTELRPSITIFYKSVKK